MSFRGYLVSIEKKTGRTPDDFRRLAAERGLAVGGALNPNVRAGEIVAWLKSDFALGHGHAMAIVALLSGKPEDS